MAFHSLLSDQKPKPELHYIIRKIFVKQKATNNVFQPV